MKIQKNQNFRRDFTTAFISVAGITQPDSQISLIPLVTLSKVSDLVMKAISEK